MFGGVVEFAVCLLLFLEFYLTIWRTQYLNLVVVFSFRFLPCPRCPSQVFFAEFYSTCSVISYALVPELVLSSLDPALHP